MRVRVPWWTLSSSLLPYNVHTQLLRQSQQELRSEATPAMERQEEDRGRGRTPSPDTSYSAVTGQQVLPPRWVFAPSLEQMAAAAQGHEHPPPDCTVQAAPRPIDPRFGRRPLTEASSSSSVALRESSITASAGAAPDASASGGTARRRRPRRKRKCALLLATQLRKLQDQDPDSVLVVRKIGPLGFNSAEILNAYFSQFGVVQEILLGSAHEREPSAAKMRLRPAGLAFVVMQTSESARSILASGLQHEVSGCRIVVNHFEKREEYEVHDDDQEAADDSEEEDTAILD